jgi:hypothetical protein
MARTVKKELDTPERFEEVLSDELSVSAEFDLPLSALALRARESFEPEAVRRARGPARRRPHLPARPRRDARRTAQHQGAGRPGGRGEAEEDRPGGRLRGSGPRRGDKAENLLKRARGAVDAPGPFAGS